MSISSTTEGARERFARNLRAWRTVRRLTQQRLAEEAGLSRVYVNKVESCLASVSLDSMEKLANVLEIDIAELLEADVIHRLP